MSAGRPPVPVVPPIERFEAAESGVARSRT